MAHHKRNKPKEKKGYTWAHRSEPDPEPDPSKSGSVVRKGKKNWIISGVRSRGRRHLDAKRSIYGRYHTEIGATQAMNAMCQQNESRAKMFPPSAGYWTDRKYKVEYVGKT